MEKHNLYFVSSNARSNNDNVIMSDLSACNATEKLAVFETGQGALAATSGSLHSARSFPITRRGRRNFPVRALTLTFFNLYFAREGIFLLGTFSKRC